jgi:hypothetical protein
MTFAVVTVPAAQSGQASASRKADTPFCPSDVCSRRSTGHNEGSRHVCN